MKIAKGKTYLNVGGFSTRGCIVKITNMNYRNEGRIKYEVIKEPKEKDDLYMSEWAYCPPNKFREFFVPVDRKVKRLK